MWRNTIFPENENSDQSISEDDDLNEDLLEDHVSLSVPADNKGEVQILSQLDMLRDANEIMHERKETSLLKKRQADIYIEDDVEFPFFANMFCTPQKASSNNSDEDIVSDNEERENCMKSSNCSTSKADNYKKIGPSSFEGYRKDGICTWLEANAEAAALVNVNDNAKCAPFGPVSAKAKRSCIGGQCKDKRRFSIRIDPHNDSLSKDVSHLYESYTSIKVKETDELEDYVMSAEWPVSHAHTMTSMAELLVRVQDDNDLQEGTMKYNKRMDASEQLPIKKSTLSIGHRYIDDDPDSFDIDSSDENEDNHQFQEHTDPESKQKSIADQFQEALGAAATNKEGHIYAVPRHTHCSFGLFGKLQRVMQSEKERDSYFLNNLKKEDETSCFDVKILSKSLEGKLTVCSCSSIKNDEGSTRIDNHKKSRNLTIIFSSRICSDVELDVGILIRVHSPWKEVDVKGNEENIILSTYFSQI